MGITKPIYLLWTVTAVLLSSSAFAAPVISLVGTGDFANPVSDPSLGATTSKMVDWRRCSSRISDGHDVEF